MHCRKYVNRAAALPRLCTKAAALRNHSYPHTFTERHLFIMLCLNFQNLTPRNHLIHLVFLQKTGQTVFCATAELLSVTARFMNIGIGSFLSPACMIVILKLLRSSVCTIRIGWHDSTTMATCSHHTAPTDMIRFTHNFIHHPLYFPQ